MKEFAIKENHLFVKTYTKGSRFATASVCVYVLRDLRASKLRKENPEKKYLNRIGFTASTKLGNAVTRNRCKRVMRAAYRAVAAEYAIKTGNLIVIAARERAATASSAAIGKELIAAFSKLGLIDKAQSRTTPET